MRRKEIFGIDADDVLLKFNEPLLEKANKKFGTNYSLEDIKAWGPTGISEIDARFEFADAEFYRTQPEYPGAREFVKYLSQRFEVIVATAVAPEFAGLRIQRLIELFPELNKENILITSRKDLVSLDYLFDDGSHNILDSNAKNPIMLRRPWNNHISGLLSVNNYDECISLIECIRKAEFEPENKSIPEVIALVGPTGSNKNKITDYLINTYSAMFSRPICFTTNACQTEKHYKIVSDAVFDDLKRENHFFETTVYAGFKYGIPRRSINMSVDRKIIVIPIDICGAMALKNTYGDKCKTVFCKIPKEKVVNNIISKNDIPNEEKAVRILSLTAELNNKEICDIIVDSTDIVKASNDLLNLFSNERTVI